MKSNQFIRKIKNYSFISFVLPLITLNLCLLLYKVLGNIDTFPNFNLNEEKIEFLISEADSYPNKTLLELDIKPYTLLELDIKSYTFTNCSKYKYRPYYITVDNEVLDAPFTGSSVERISLSPEKIDYIESLKAEGKIRSIKYIPGKIINDRCVKNYEFLYSVLINFNILEKILINAKNKNLSGFAKIKNPYLYGEVSISRTARYYPAILIFKPLLILSAIFLFLYWKNNLSLYIELKNKNTLNEFSKKFFYFGVISCIFLILHALFLGLTFDSKLFEQIRRLIIILFIFFEVLAQIFLTRNLYKLKESLKNYINPLILKIKIIFVTTTFFVTCLVSYLLVLGDLSTSLKHILEWNYFSALLVYYFLSVLLWRRA